jgi:hypothetical protein
MMVDIVEGITESILNLDRASFSAATQKPASSVLDSRQLDTLRLCQSMIATK